MLAAEMKAAGKEIEFVKINVDALASVAQDLGITAMPTFQLYRGKDMIGDVIGADYDKVKALVEKNLPAAGA